MINICEKFNIFLRHREIRIILSIISERSTDSKKYAAYIDDDLTNTRLTLFSRNKEINNLEQSTRALFGEGRHEPGTWKL